MGEPNRNGITGIAVDLRLVLGTVLRLLFAPVLDKMYPRKLNAIFISAAHYQENTRYPIAPFIIMMT